MKNKSIKRRLKIQKKCKHDSIVNCLDCGITLDEIVEGKYKEELKIADSRWKRAEDKLRDYEED